MIVPFSEESDRPQPVGPKPTNTNMLMAAAQMQAEGKDESRVGGQKPGPKPITEMEALTVTAEELGDLAPKGVKSETMRKSANVEDVRQPPEGGLGGTGIDPERVAKAYFHGQISEKDFEEIWMRQSTDKDPRLPKEAGMEDMQHLAGTMMLKQAFKAMKAMKAEGRK